MTITARARKFSVLKELSGDFNVPPLILLQEQHFERLFQDFQSKQVGVNNVLARIAQTHGNNLPSDLDELQRIASTLTFSEHAEITIKEVLNSNFADPSAAKLYAVRSASIAEDSDIQSFAGLYDTHLNVTSVPALLNAIRSVWLSSLRQNVVLEQLKSGARPLLNPMAIILQEMIDAHTAGIAFSIDPLGDAETCIVEEVSGLGNSLVSGAEPGTQYRFNRTTLSTYEPQHRHARVAKLCLAVEEKLGHAVDIEWACKNEKIYLLQARPITALENTESVVGSPFFRSINLYEGSEDDLGEFGTLPEFARYFRLKRKKIFDFGKSVGIKSGAAVLVSANGQGLASKSSQEILRAVFTTPEVVIDFNSSVRQLIVDTKNLSAQLAALMPSDSNKIVKFVVREFVRGKVGIISEFHPPESIILEWSEDGLLAMNRGTAIASRAIVSCGDLACDAPLTTEQVSQIYSATSLAQEKVGPIRIEWVADGKDVYVIDYSAVCASTSISSSAATISEGLVEAPVLCVEGTADIKAISIASSVSLTSIPDLEEMGGLFDRYLSRLEVAGSKPVIVVDRPYAALAALLPYVSGFIFEQGSLLCHLAILLRERNIPAVQSEDAFHLAASARQVRIDTFAAIPISILR